MQPLREDDLVERVLNRLSRKTTSGRYVREVDGFRFVAIALVVVYHTEILLRTALGTAHLVPPFGSIVRDQIALPHRTWVVHTALQGWLGVHLFFMVSGFILALPFISEYLHGGPKVSVARYYLRRVTRLEPPYMLALTLLFILALATPIGIGTTGLVGHFAAGLGYTHGLAFGGFNPIDGPVWSLEIEIQFYLLVPLLVGVFRIRDRATRRGAILLLAAASVAAGLLIGGRIPLFSFTVVNYFPYFLAGFLLADVFLTDWKEQPRPRWGWDVVSLAGWPAMLLLARYWRPQLEAYLLPLIAVLLFAAAFRGRLTRLFFRNRWIATIGGMCYSIYLLHYPVIFLLGKYTGPWLQGSFTSMFLMQLAFVAPAVLAIGLGFYVLIERPCMDPGWPGRVRRLIHGVGGPAAVPQPLVGLESAHTEGL